MPMSKIGSPTCGPTWHAKGHPNEQEIVRKDMKVLCDDHEEPKESYG
jgi:hypothetical protein